jgi:hypothetical protein
MKGLRIRGIMAILPMRPLEARRRPKRSPLLAPTNETGWIRALTAEEKLQKQENRHRQTKENKFQSIIDRLFVLTKIPTAETDYAEKRRAVERSLRVLFDPTDPDHPGNLTLPPDAKLGERLAGASRGLLRVRSMLETPSPENSVPPDGIEQEAIDPRLVALDPAAIIRLTAALVSAQAELSALQVRAQEQIGKGRPVKFQDAALIQRFAHCWKTVSGVWPSATVVAGKGDSGPFAQWVTEALHVIYPEQQFPRPPNWGAASTSIRDAIDYLRKRDFMPE